MTADALSPHRELRPPTSTPPVHHRLRRRRSPDDPTITGQPLYLPWWQLTIVPVVPTDGGHWLCTTRSEQSDQDNPCGFLLVGPDDIATGVTGPATWGDLVAIWLTTVEARCGNFRTLLGHALIDAARPGHHLVPVDEDTYRTRYRAAVSIRSYGGFCRALRTLERAGLIAWTDDPDVVHLTLIMEQP